MHQKRLAAGLWPDLLREPTALYQTPPAPAGFKGCGQGQVKGKGKIQDGMGQLREGGRGRRGDGR